MPAGRSQITLSGTAWTRCEVTSQATQRLIEAGNACSIEALKNIFSRRERRKEVLEEER